MQVVSPECIKTRGICQESEIRRGLSCFRTGLTQVSSTWISLGILAVHSFCKVNCQQVLCKGMISCPFSS